MDFASICTPARLYFMFILFSSLYSFFTQVALIRVFLGLIYGAVWTWILNWLCSKGYTWLSWFLVLLPMLFFIVGMFDILKLEQRKNVQQEEKK